jgi:hypothetical protein
VGPGLRRDDGCGRGSFEQADTAFVERCCMNFRGYTDRRSAKGGLLELVRLVPRTQGVAGFMRIEQAVEAACSAPLSGPPNPRNAEF